MAESHQMAFKFVAAICLSASLYVCLSLMAVSHTKYEPIVTQNNKLVQQSVEESVQESVQVHSSAGVLTDDKHIETIRADNDNDRTHLTHNSVVHRSFTFDQLIVKRSRIHLSHPKQVHSFCDYHLSLIFTETDTNGSLDRKLYQLLLSIFGHIDDMRLCIHLMVDSYSHLMAKSVIERIADQSLVKQSAKSVIAFYFHNITAANSLIEHLLPSLTTHFSYQSNSYYSHSLFFLSLVLHRIFDTIGKMLVMDVDVQLNDKLAQLYSYFDEFGEQTLIGIAYEQQPVYRHILHDYRRSRHNLTRFGGPPDKGLPGFNSGVMLMHLENMRKSRLYNSLLSAETIERLCRKYSFRGHLGDQDFYTVVSFDYPQLFHVIPCYWNRQLCQWWRYHGYELVFDDYNRCDAHIKLFHGNCNAVMPNYLMV